jgi:hypothetical protein
LIKGFQRVALDRVQIGEFECHNRKMADFRGRVNAADWKREP